MKLTPPKNITWFVALALAVLALLGYDDVILPKRLRQLGLGEERKRRPRGGPS